MQGTRAASGDERVALAVFQHVETHHNGGIFLGADGPGGFITHLNGLGAVVQGDAVQRNVVLGSGLADQCLIAHADDLHAVLLDRGGRALQHRQRGVVAAHHIHNDLHRYSFLIVRILALSVIASQCHLSQSERPWQSPQCFRFCQGLPLWERFPPVGGKWQSQKGE